MTCPCPRPPGLTDEAAWEAIVTTDQAVGLVGVPYPVRMIAGGPWHLVEWRQCDRFDRAGMRCHIRAGHFLAPELHDLEPGHGWTAIPPWTPQPHLAERDQGWPVPCWVTTAAEAEQWRPRDHAACLCDACLAARGQPVPSEHAHVKVTELRDATYESDYEGDWLREPGGSPVSLCSLVPDAAARGHYRITVEFTPTKSAEEIARDAERAKLRHEIALDERDEANARDKAKALREQVEKLGQ